jgi:DNA-binding SARP family transcriptional activator
VGKSAQEFQVLGDLSVTVDGERRPITAAKQRAVLAILLLSPNRTVSSVSLFDGIWGAALPQHPHTALQIVVSRLRGSLGPAAHRLVSGPSGYRMEVEANELDISLAQSAFAEGQRLSCANDPSRAADVLGAALRRWTSEPLHDLVAFPFCPAARNRLRELRVSIYELRNDALLEAGRHIEVLESIEEWISAEPWRERLRAQHVLALYRSGRQVDALRAYDAYRDHLVEELGVEPSSELRELHRDVLSHAPELAIRGGPLGSRIPLWTSLSLPFVGRGDEQELIFGRIRDVFAGSRMMVLVEGEAGIGKTRLVLEIARRVEDDAIILSATANDSMRPAVVGLAHALVAVVSQLPDDELRQCLGCGPDDLAAAVPSLRDRLPDLVPALDGDAAGRGQRLVSSVASCVTALSRRAPIVLLLDDLHRSGASLLFLLGRLMVADEQQRILILATARTRYPDRSSNLVDLAEQLERRGRLDRMRLEGLGAESVERLLCRLGTHEPAAKARLLHEVTNGQPFFLGEILQTDDWQRALVDPPASVREFVRRRVHALGDAEEGILVDAAGLGIAFDAPLLAEITGVPRATTAALIDRGVAAGVLRTVGKGTFTFVHELCRRALLDRLDGECRARLHHRIATSLEGRDLPPTVLAMHWRLVPGREAAQRTLRYARVAGDAALLDLDPGAAATWYAIALAATEDPDTRRELLVDAADARDQAEKREVSRRLEV